jgi:hypothetical protein
MLKADPSALWKAFWKDVRCTHMEMLKLASGGKKD